MAVGKDELQCAKAVLMVRPRKFGFNSETAVNNVMQKQIDQLTADQVSQRAVQEFDAMVRQLESNGVQVVVVQDENEEHPTPDSVFPNNWFSTHATGTDSLQGPHICIYPMFAPNRRRERDSNVLCTLKTHFGLDQMVDLSASEADGVFLEGTGSLVLDHVDKIAYVARSSRSDEMLSRKWCRMYDYTPVVFDAVDVDGCPIYHTNVCMSVGSDFAIVCLDVVKEKEALLQKLSSNGKTVIEITEKQMNLFAGNALQLRNENGQALLVMSATGWNSLNEDQRHMIQRFATPVTPNIETIETVGGGSCRCMLAELFVSEPSP